MRIDKYIELPTAEVVYREDLYPRMKTDPALVQSYAGNLEQLPPIEINQDNILIDGWHRLTAHRSKKQETIKAIVTETGSERQVRLLAIKRNNDHGWQLTDGSKKREAIWLYGAGTGSTKEEIAECLSVTSRTVTNYLENVDKQLKEERKQKIRDMYLACYTQEEIAAKVGTSEQPVKDALSVFLEELPKYPKASFLDENWKPPLYNVWTFAKKTNEVSHFGNSEQRILDNLLYLYTEAFVVVGIGWYELVGIGCLQENRVMVQYLRKW